MSDFKKLQVWDKAHALALSVDRVSKRIRGSQYASLRSQIFRAATSIPANIAEGRRQESEKEFARFLRYALNSASELEYHLILARDTDVMSKEDFASLISQTITVRKMLYGLLKRLDATRSDANHEPPPAATGRPADSTRQVVLSSADSSCQHSVADSRRQRSTYLAVKSDSACAPEQTGQ